MESDSELEEKVAFPVKVEPFELPKKLQPLHPATPLSEVINRFNVFEEQMTNKIYEINADLEKVKEYLLIFGERFSFKQTERSRLRKKNRRTADKIERKFKCEYPKCGRAYGTHSSLQCHIKLKHLTENNEENIIVESGSDQICESQFEKVREESKVKDGEQENCKEKEGKEGKENR